MSALTELRNAFVGWLDLLANRPGAMEAFNLSRAGFLNAVGWYFAVVVTTLLLGIAMGNRLDPVGLTINIALNAVPLLIVVGLGSATAAFLSPREGTLAMLVPAVYALAFILVIRLPLAFMAGSTFTNALLGALGFMLYRAARGGAGFGVGISAAFAILCLVALVVLTLGLYMLSA